MVLFLVKSMVEHEKPASWWQRIIQKLSAVSPFSNILAESLHHLDRFVLRVSGERTTATCLLTGLPVVWVTTIGARSGEQRTTPLLSLQDGERLVLIATSFGRSRNPGWYYNIKANPNVNVSFNGCSGTYVAREVTGEERESYWRQAVSLYPGYGAYKERAGERLIPVIVLTPEET